MIEISLFIGRSSVNKLRAVQKQTNIRLEKIEFLVKYFSLIYLNLGLQRTLQFLC